MRYYVVYEQTDAGWSAYVPDLPGVAVAGATREETRELARGAIVMHRSELASATASELTSQ